MELTSSQQDLNNYTDPAITYYWNAATPVNAPFNWATMKVIKGGTNIIQICYRTATTMTKIRYGGTDGNWSEWV